ncbi:MAG: hypothetical protein QM602_03365 [Microbacterium sp.]
MTLPTGVSVAEAHPEVWVFTADDAQEFVESDEIDADGSFGITGIAPGDYRIMFSTYGANIAREWWENADDADGAQTVTLGEGEVYPANATLDPGATIAGTVTGGVVEDGHGWVLAFRQTAEGLYNEGYARIAEDGTYVVEGLRPGTYTLLFSDYGGFGEVSDLGLVAGWAEWWEDAMSADAATTVLVERQQQLIGFDVDLDTVGGVPTWPVVSGTLRVGGTLTTTTGPWPDGTTFQYRWYADGEEIAGARASTLVLTSAQRGTHIEAAVFGEKPGEDGYESKFSGLTGAVAAGKLTAANPTISGSVAHGSTLTAKPGTWTSKTSFSYQWYANGRAISKATKSTFTLASAQKGKKITVKVTGKKSGYTTVAKTSKATGKVATAAKPKISGTAKVGAKLTAKPGTWTKGTTFSYRWYADGKAISKATKSTFTIAAAQVGKKVTVTVTGRKSGYATVSKTSKATARVLKAAKPKISGAEYVTKKLTADPGTWTSGATLSYQRYADGKAISGATKSTIRLGAAQGGKRITVRVSGKKAGYTSASKLSKATGKIGYPSSTAPSGGRCPSWAPIKGNASSMIYHLPGQRFYDVTDPEECFRTESAAQEAGYRKAKV